MHVEIVIIYLSLTGNTFRVAKMMSSAFRKSGHSSRMVNLKNATIGDVIEGDLMGFGTPCISSKAPTPMKSFLRSLPPIPGRNAFIFSTTGGAPGRVLSEISRILVSKGANVLGDFSTHGQVNHPAPHLVGRFPNRPNSFDLDQAHQFALELIARLSDQPSKPLPGKREVASISNWGYFSLLGLISSDRVARVFLPKPRLDQFLCNQCKLCADECPMDNIFMNPKPIIGNKCIRCYRCFNVCPKKAFDVNWSFADPFLRILYNTYFIRWFGNLNPGEKIY